jgi:hypothetical protein
VAGTSADAPADTVSVGDPYLLGPEGQQFAAPVTVTLAFSPELLPAGASASDVVIYTAPAGTVDYQPLSTGLVDGTHVSALTTHFSIFVAAVAKKHHDEDLAVPADLSVAGGPDLASIAPDLSSTTDASAGDFGTTVCTPVVQPGQLGGCSVSATCGGHTYLVSCNGNSQCTCTTDNVQKSGYVIGIGTCASTNGQPAWGSCGFP